MLIIKGLAIMLILDAQDFLEKDIVVIISFLGVFITAFSVALLDFDDLVTITLSRTRAREESTSFLGPINLDSYLNILKLFFLFFHSSYLSCSFSSIHNFFAFFSVIGILFFVNWGIFVQVSYQRFENIFDTMICQSTNFLNGDTCKLLDITLTYNTRFFVLP